MKIEFTFMGEPVPAARARVTRYGHAYTPQKYAAYKKALAAALKADYGFWAWEVPPVGSKERKKFLDRNKYTLSLRVYRKANRGDLDNYTKAVVDAIQDAGMIANDTQIVRYVEPFEMLIDTENPRVELTLERVQK